MENAHDKVTSIKFRSQDSSCPPPFRQMVRLFWFQMKNGMQTCVLLKIPQCLMALCEKNLLGNCLNYHLCTLQFEAHAITSLHKLLTLNIRATKNASASGDFICQTLYWSSSPASHWELLSARPEGWRMEIPLSSLCSCYFSFKYPGVPSCTGLFTVWGLGIHNARWYDSIRYDTIQYSIR